jgi:hypothetical protein
MSPQSHGAHEEGVVTVSFVNGRWHVLNKAGFSFGDYSTFKEANDARRLLLLKPFPFTLSSRR